MTLKKRELTDAEMRVAVGLPPSRLRDSVVSCRLAIRALITQTTRAEEWRRMNKGNANG